VSVADRLRRWRDWLPVPTAGLRPRLARWVLLEGHRLAVTGALVTFVYVTITLVGTVWTFEMQELLTETPTVENLLDTFLSGIILLVSIVVSINSIVLSHDITSVGTQEDRIEGIMEFRRDIGGLTESGQRPSDPSSFLSLLSDVIDERAAKFEATLDGTDEEFTEAAQSYTDAIESTIGRLGAIEESGGAEFGVLWMGLEIDYGTHLDRSRAFEEAYGDRMCEEAREELHELIRTLELFAIGKEYFKTLYYSREVSQLSRTLLVVSLPAILINSSAVLAINAEIFPEVWLFGLPPLTSFVATVFTISLVPYVILTSYMLRLATVARRTATGGLFSLT